MEKMGDMHAALLMTRVIPAAVQATADVVISLCSDYANAGLYDCYGGWRINFGALLEIGNDRGSVRIEDDGTISGAEGFVCTLEIGNWFDRGSVRIEDDGTISGADDHVAYRLEKHRPDLYRSVNRHISNNMAMLP